MFIHFSIYWYINPIFNGGGVKLPQSRILSGVVKILFILFVWNIVIHVFWKFQTDSTSQNGFMGLFSRVGGVFSHFSNFIFLAYNPIFLFPRSLLWLVINLCSSYTSFHTILCMSNKKYKFTKTKLLKILNIR